MNKLASSYLAALVLVPLAALHAADPANLRWEYLGKEIGS
jgi:hypothetical protein